MSAAKSNAPGSRRQPVRPSGRGAGALSGSRVIPILVGVAVVGLAILIGVLSTREAANVVALDDIAGTVSVEGDRLSQFGGSVEADPHLGQPGPRVQGADFDGQAVTIGEPGTPTILSFMASWCPACQQELPVLVDWIDRGGLPDDVDLVVISTGLDDRRPNWPPDRWLEREGYDGPVLVDDGAGTVAAVYGLSATPFWVVLDANGDVAMRFAGMLSEAQFDDLVAIARGP